MERTCLAVILAAGDSTRMKSSKSKVLHPVAGRPMIAHVVEAVASAGISSVALVVGRDAEDVAKAASVAGVGIESYLQMERLGTGHAVLAAREAIAKGYDDILVTYGDVPLQTDAPLKAARQGLPMAAMSSSLASTPTARPATVACSSRMANSSPSARRRTRPMPSAPSPGATAG